MTARAPQIALSPLEARNSHPSLVSDCPLCRELQRHPMHAMTPYEAMRAEQRDILLRADLKAMLEIPLQPVQLDDSNPSTPA